MIYIPQSTNLFNANEKRKRFYGVKEFSTNSSSLVISSPNQYWNLNETNGIRSNSVLGAGSYDLVLGYNKNVDSLAGKISNAANFENINGEYLVCEEGTACAAIFGGFSASCWIYATSVTAEQHVIGKWEPGIPAGNGREWGLIINGDGSGIDFCTTTDGTTDFLHLSSSGPISTNTWYFIVATYSSGTKKVYKNGILISTGTDFGSVHQTVHPFTVGAGEETVGQIAYAGRIDEVGYWNKVLTQDEITELYNGGAGKTFNGILWV